MAVGGRSERRDRKVGHWKQKYRAKKYYKQKQIANAYYVNNLMRPYKT